jgi:hypothetical protein
VFAPPGGAGWSTQPDGGAAGFHGDQVVNDFRHRAASFKNEIDRLSALYWWDSPPGANAAVASQAGHYNSNSTVVTPSGTYNVQTTGYSPTAAAIAQSNAAAQNDAMISATIERGQANMAALESSVIKDNTLFPGEWYGGRLYLQPPMSSDGPKNYQM